MPFTPFTKKDAVAPDTSASDAPAFAKAKSRKRGRRKPGKVAPAQKSLMQGASRSMAGGRR